MIEIMGGVHEARLYIIGLKVIEIINDLGGAHAAGEKFQHVRHADAHRTHGRPPHCLGLIVIRASRSAAGDGIGGRVSMRNGMRRLTSQKNPAIEGVRP